MFKLKKVDHPMFKEYFEGTNGSRKVTCILDDNCVRYLVLEPGRMGTMKVRTRREYGNDNKSRCFTNAETALNK